MPLWRLQCSWQLDSALPRDQIVITPHFNDAGALTDPDSLCTDLAAGLKAWSRTGVEINVKAYDAEGTPPVFPQGEAVENDGIAPPSSGVPREIAVCLSYYSQRNVPRQRGRLYIPLCVAAGTYGLGARPNVDIRTKVAALVPLFTGLGGADVDWVVFSRTDGQARPVSNWWVDDEWDTVRSRGLRPTTRDQGTASE